MKTTVELPDKLVREIKHRAVAEGRKLKDLVAELLQIGLEAPHLPPHDEHPSYVVRDALSGLPVIQCNRAPGPDEQLTPERVADLLLQQEVSWWNETT